MRERVGRGKAFAKAILLGEHAVVYGWPAIAVPLPQLRAQAEARFDPRQEGVAVEALTRRGATTVQRDAEQPLAKAALLALAAAGATPSNVAVRLDSAIPIASGLGSGAAVSTAIARAVLDLMGTRLPPDQLSALVYEVEKIHHGTPSGIDNTVVVFGRPVYFRRGFPPEFISLGAAVDLVVADTGVGSATREAVAALRRAREADEAGIDAQLAAIGDIVERGRAALEAGDVEALGRLMDADHTILAALDLSSPRLDALVAAARAAGALGAKLTGAGRGGHAIALVHEADAAAVAAAMEAAGAQRATHCRVEQPS